MATVVVTNLRSVSIDGTVAGTLVDVCRNYPQSAVKAGEILAAVEAWRDGVKAQNDSIVAAKDASIAEVHRDKLAAVDAVKAEREADKQAHATRMAELQNVRDALKSEVQTLRDLHVADIAAIRAEHRDKLAEKQALIDAMGGTEVGRQLAREAKRKAAQDAKAAAEAALAALDAEAVV